MDFHDTYRELPDDFKAIETEVIQTDILGYEYNDGYVKIETDGTITIFIGFEWSASGPTIDSPWTRRGSKYHDALYYLSKQGVFKGKWSKKVRKQADKLLYHTMKKDANTPQMNWYLSWTVLQVRYIRCELWYNGVRWAGSSRWE